MKKAKIVLSAVALLAIAGGAVAFKAARFNAGTHFYTTSSTVVDGSTIYYCTANKNLVTAPVGAFTAIAFPSTVLSAGRTLCTGAPITNTIVTTVGQ